MRQVAMRLIGQGGYDAMTLAQVGELAGYSRGLATHHFGSKAGLLDSILDAVVAANRQAFEKATRGKRGRARLAAVVDSSLNRCLQMPDAARAYLILALDPTARAAAASIAAQTREWRKQAEEAAREATQLGELSPACEPADVASVAMAMARGYAYEWAADPSTDIRAARRRIRGYIASLPT